MKKLSIITVNLNNLSGLVSTYNSVMSQTFHDFEWIIIDGGSSDGSKEFIEKHAAHFSSWISEKDDGIYYAMNKGIHLSNGEYLQFLNSGDFYYSSSVLEEVFSLPASADVLYGNISRYLNGVEMDIFKYSKSLSYFTLLKQPLGHNCCFFKRTIFSNNLYDESYKIASDWKLTLSLALQNKSFCYINKTICCFDMSGISSTASDTLHDEQISILNEVCPSLLLNDFINNNLLSSYTAHTSTEEFISLRLKYPFLGKIITAIVILMKFLNHNQDSK